MPNIEEVVDESLSSKGSSASGSEVGYANKKRRVLDAWFNDPKIAEDMVRDDDRIRCKICEIDISCYKANVTRHLKSKSHREKKNKKVRKRQKF